MRPCGGRIFAPYVLCALLLAPPFLRANPGDAENSQDYPGFPRQPGFVISDYAEDNPAESDFPISRPLPLDADHVEMSHVRGHRFVIRYELSTGNSPTVYQTQLYYEKLAAAGGYQVAKSGAVGDVTETFWRTMPNHDIWVYLEPSNNVAVLTVIEAPRGSAPVAPPAPRMAVTPPSTLAIIPPPSTTLAPPGTPALIPPPETTIAPVGRITPVPVMPSPEIQVAPTITPVPVPAPAPAPAPSPAASPAPSDPEGEALYVSLSQDGRIVVPFVFQPGKEELDATSQPLVDRIAAMMKHHPELFLRIEGHTDNSGDPEDNLRLSAQRAIAVQTKLVGVDVDPKRLDAVGVGGLQPLADNNTAEGREKNRRIELVVWKKYAHHTPPAGA